MSTSNERRLSATELRVAEQGLLNLATREDVRIIKNGVDITDQLLAQGETIALEYDALHPKPAAMPAKGSKPVKVRPPLNKRERPMHSAEAEDAETPHQHAERRQRETGRKTIKPSAARLM